MMHTIDLRGRSHTAAELLALVPRAAVDVAVASEAASTLIEEVRAGGSEALLAQADRFDGGRPPSLRVPAAEIADAVATLDPAVRRALEETIRRVRLASTAQVPPNTVTEIGPGARIRQRWQPIARVGLYVPGGKAVYPSSVVMNVVPAQVAGVSSIALVSPPQRDHGSHVHPVVLAAAGLLGIDEVYAMGGAGAIGALAYGVADLGLEPVQLVTGPGNVYVAAAKRRIRGQAGIDAEAGPTDILVIADAAADARLVAADLISQAEHDELAAAVLVTDSAGLAEAVGVEVERQVAATRHRERVTAALTGEQSAVVLVDDLDAAADFSNAFGPEHLEIQTTDAEAVLARIQNAGAIFLGPHSPVSLGDYAAGSNHVLPTGGQARFTAGLNAATFLRSQQVVEYTKDGLADVAESIAALSATEALPAHGDAVVARFS
ncbi:histidinol dehydrogenase [Leifsonia sp. Leaf264]|uniref:histidinol dehydrogenase n=1 Tax=Leifsonia sp. Leaf264 TaxID=1736314 RepID=UPI0009EB1EBA|nr:histidinol dehydrogenase [Leifsonia sp. Leaf264]